VSVKVTSKDRGWKRIMEVAKEIAASKPHVAVGLVGATGSAERAPGLDNAGLGAIHEYGMSGMPQRSFIGATVDENKDAYVKQMVRTAGEDIVAGRGLDRSLKLAGLRVVGDIQQKIADGIPPPNSPVTIARKGSSKPLVDSGQLRQSLSFEVRK
jgi:phage gpG-like protein